MFTSFLIQLALPLTKPSTLYCRLSLTSTRQEFSSLNFVVFFFFCPSIFLYTQQKTLWTCWLHSHERDRNPRACEDSTLVLAKDAAIDLKLSPTPCAGDCCSRRACIGGRSERKCEVSCQVNTHHLHCMKSPSYIWIALWIVKIALHLLRLSNFAICWVVAVKACCQVLLTCIMYVKGVGCPWGCHFCSNFIRNS